MMSISKLWRGDYSLPITYWVFGVIGNVGLSIPMNLISPDSNTLAFYSLLALVFIYSILVSVGIWRSATKYRGLSLWKYLAKFVAILSFISIGATSVLLMPAMDFGRERTDYQLVSECRYDQLLKSKPNLEAQIWMASNDYCQQIVFNHLKEVLVVPEQKIDDLKKMGATTDQIIIALLGISVEEKKFKPVNKYQTVAQCKLDQLNRVKNSTNPNIYATGADQFCTEYIAYSFSQKIGFQINKAMTEGYTYKEIVEYIEANPKK
jgi:hypothetical protein